MKWTSEYQMLEEARVNVNKWSRRAIATAVVVVGLGYYFAPFSIPTANSLADRLAFALRWQIPSFGTLIFGILAISNKRYHSRALDPISGKDQEALMVLQKYTQNTVEQLLVSVGSQLALATYLESHQLQVIPILALLFVTGRLTFWVGYQQPELSHTNRMFGYYLTMVPSIFAYCYCLFRLVVDVF